jgi:hypothetical protein
VHFIRDILIRDTLRRIKINLKRVLGGVQNKTAVAAFFEMPAHSKRDDWGQPSFQVLTHHPYGGFAVHGIIL